MDQSRIAILGAGSLGTIMGAMVAHNGGHCVLIDANIAHVRALNDNGATVTGYVDMKNIPVKAITPDQMEGTYDLVIVLIKQTANEKALTNLLPFLHADSIVCTLQNGLPETLVSAIVGAERVIGGTVGWGGNWISPGVAQLCTEKEHMRIEIGTLDGKITDKLKRVEAFLRLAGEVDLNTNLLGIRWSKLLLNSTLSGLSAALGCTFGEIIDDDMMVTCAAHIANEVVRVSEARTIRLEQILPGYDFYELKFDDISGRNHAAAMLRSMYSAHRTSKASMLQDMEKGIPCEIDFINGIVTETGRSQGIRTPFNDKIVEIIKAFENKEIPFPTKENIKMFNISATLKQTN